MGPESWPRFRSGDLGMGWLLELHLLRAFDFYLFAVFLFGTVLRVRQYQRVVGLVRRVPGRWPRLFQLIKQHSRVFLGWRTLAPLGLTLGLWLVNRLLLQFVWPQADLTVGKMMGLWPAIPIVLGTGGVMIAYDLYSAWQVGHIDVTEVEKYFDQAEYWLRSWTAPVVRVFTLGFVNPRRIVAQEVRNALDSALQLLHSTLWAVILQTVLRLVFGASLWLTWALAPWL